MTTNSLVPELQGSNPVIGGGVGDSSRFSGLMQAFGSFRQSVISFLDSVDKAATLPAEPRLKSGEERREPYLFGRRQPTPSAAN